MMQTMGRTIEINTICRKDAKKQAPSGYVLVKKIGGFIACESRFDTRAVAENQNREYFPFKTKEAYLKAKGRI